MSLYENLGNRILELLNCPTIEKCPELGLLFERCSIRELQAIFPTIINSIFAISTGGIGWGLRVTTHENSPQNYEILHNFFMPLGPIFRLCYRLLNEAIKFDFLLEYLPHKMCEYLQSGQHSMFYADLVNIDPFKRCITSLSLNAFDYYILNFAIHGTYPLHKMYPAALQVHNERLKTVYFYLSAQYLCTFLPSNPDNVVMPTNICGSVKAPQPMPVQPLQPTRSPKYLKISPCSSHYASQNQTRNSESPRTFAWRTESVLYLFIDVWLRFDVDEARDLPSSEFIRVVRILVKQAHSFANSASFDTTSMVVLRKLTQPMMKARIYPFLKSIIARWPLDSSLSVVLELWLSYIQPWRYVLNAQSESNIYLEIPIGERFESYISDNLAIYTQIFIILIPRFERLDFSSYRNVLMLYRLIKVFSQPGLKNIIHTYEQCFTNTFSPSQMRHSSFNRLRNESSGEWDSFPTDSFYQDYIPMFGNEVKYIIEAFMKTVVLSQMYVEQEIQIIDSERYESELNMVFWRRWMLKLFKDESRADFTLREFKKIPELLQSIINAMQLMFCVNLQNMSIEEVKPNQYSYSDLNFSLMNSTDSIDFIKVSPAQMMNNIANLQPMIDPALLPIEGHECTALVRFLYKVSTKINEMFSDEISFWWNRNDIWGRIGRKVLSPPMTAKWFDKPRGINELCEEELPPRISLRLFGSYKTLLLIVLFLIAGNIFWDAPSYGFFVLIGFVIIYVLISSLFS